MHVRAVVHAVATRLFGRHVRRRSQDDTGTRELIAVLLLAQTRKPKVEHFGVRMFGHAVRELADDEHVLGLPIAMYGAVGVSFYERVGDLERDALRRDDGQWTVFLRQVRQVEASQCSHTSTANLVA